MDNAVAAATVPSDESVRGAFTTPTGVDRGFASYDGLAVAIGVPHPIWTDTRNLGRLREEIYTTLLVAKLELQAPLVDELLACASFPDAWAGGAVYELVDR